MGEEGCGAEPGIHRRLQADDLPPRRQRGIPNRLSYTVTKDGLVKAKITRLGGSEDVVKKAKGSVPVGLEFRFKWKVDGDKATLDDLDGKDVEQVKQHLEGEYTKKS